MNISCEHVNMNIQVGVWTCDYTMSSSSVRESTNSKREEHHDGVTTMPPLTIMRNHTSIKRDRKEHHTQMIFANENDYKSYFICGQHKTKNVSPCVDVSTLTECGLVYEEWQEQNSNRSKKWFYCRRQRDRRRKGNNA